MKWYISFVNVTISTTLDTVINLPSDKLGRPRGRTVGGNCLKRGNTILSTLKNNHYYSVYIFTNYVVLLGSQKCSAITTTDTAVLKRSSVIKGGGVAEWFRALEFEIWRPGSNPSPYRYLDLFSVAPSSTPRPRGVNSQLVSLPSVGILNSLCSICNIWSFINSVPN